MKKARYAAVICEYNPFHYGHLHQLNAIREKGFLPICILGGNLTQRGGISLADKYTRALCALNAGACLVLELPIPFCASSAKDFANSGVFIANAIHTDALAFSAECDGETLVSLKNEMCSPAFAERFSDISKTEKDLSYPKRLEYALSLSLGEEKASLIRKPNNILSLEYLRALENTALSPLILERDTSFLPSSEIRKSGKREEILSLLPEESKKVLEKDNSFPRDPKRLDSFFIGNMRKGTESKNIYGVTDDLYRKIQKNCFEAGTLEELAEKCADKNYTKARVRRAVMALVFGFYEKSVKEAPAYTSVLACDGNGREFLSEIKGNTEIEILTKPSGIIKKSKKAQEQFSLSLRTERIIALSSESRSEDTTKKSPLIIDRKQ